MSSRFLWLSVVRMIIVILSPAAYAAGDREACAQLALHPSEYQFVIVRRGPLVCLNVLGYWLQPVVAGSCPAQVKPLHGAAEAGAATARLRPARLSPAAAVTARYLWLSLIHISEPTRLGM